MDSLHGMASGASEARETRKTTLQGRLHDGREQTQELTEKVRRIAMILGVSPSEGSPTEEKPETLFTPIEITIENLSYSNRLLSEIINTLV